MTVAVDTANVARDTTSWTYNAGPPANFTTTTSVTIAAPDTLLMVAIGTRYNDSPYVPPDTVTFNGVALTQLTNEGIVSFWYLASPPVGTYTLVGEWTSNTTGGLTTVVAIPISGAATSSTFSTPATPAASASNNNPAITATGGSSGSLYIAAAYNGVVTTTATGAGQVNINGTGGTQFNSDASVSLAVSTIPGSGSGAFTWTGSGAVDATEWAAIAVNINAAGGTSTPPSSMFLTFPGAASAAPLLFMPLGWVINRRNKMAKRKS